MLYYVLRPKVFDTPHQQILLEFTFLLPSVPRFAEQKQDQISAPRGTMSHHSTHPFTTPNEALGTFVVEPPTLLKVSTGAGNFAIFDEAKQSGCGGATNTTEKNESLMFFMPLLKFCRSGNDDGDDHNKLMGEDDSDEPLLERYVTCFGADSYYQGTSQAFPSIGETLMGMHESFLEAAANLPWNQ